MLRFLVCLIVFIFSASQTTAKHAVRAEKLVITDAMVITGVGTPAEGPLDIVISANKIERISAGSPNSEHRKNATLIDAKGKYVMPGFINMHGHTMYNRAGIDMDQPYQYYMWLGSGITSVRDLGSDWSKTSVDREKSKKNEIIAPRLFIYPGTWGHHKADDVRKLIQKYKDDGADGLKFGMMDKETFYAASDEAQKLKLKVANHVGVEDMNAWDNAAMKTTTIEHWYGIPDAALKDGIQHFPADMNYSNELDRFRYAGRLWREADPDKLHDVLQELVKNNVAWDVTLSIYEASRDLQRAVTSPWFDDYLHPGLEKFFKPNLDSHGSFFLGWTNTDEVYWRENFQIWFKAVRDFEKMGGIITTGEDGGYIYKLFGFGYLQELLLHEEAGFTPLQVIRHATYNSAKVLGMGDKIGHLKVGYLADLIIVNGNPMADLRALWPRGIKNLTDDRDGGIEWTIKDGIPYHAPTMWKAVRDIVKKSRETNKIGYLID